MKILTVIGARPQFIKAAPLSKAAANGGVEEILLHTGQHFDKNMSEVFFEQLNIPQPKYNLDISGGGHGAMTGKMLEGIETIIQEEKPDYVLVFGDTNSTLAGSLGAAKLHVPVAHVEAGLRSWNRKMPEEVNRVLTDHISNQLFCSSPVSVENLKNEGITSGVHMVGDIMADASRLACEVVLQDEAKYLECLPEGVNKGDSFVLLTTHRAENTDDPAILGTIVDKINEHDSEPFIFPLHPRTKAKLAEFNLSFKDHVHVIDPVGYLEMNALLMNASKVATDSGGLQKEAYWLDKPCVTMRSETEWVETVEEKCNVLWDPSLSLAEMWGSLDMSCKKDATYGDAYAAEKIIEAILKA